MLEIKPCNKNWHTRGDDTAARIAAAAPGLGVHRLQAAEKLLRHAHDLQILPTLTDIRTTCEQSLPPHLAQIASRLIAGHCGLLA